MTIVTMRPERVGDAAAISALTASAFAGVEHSDGSEPAIVERLRAKGDLALSLVAEDDDGIVGHLAVSPVDISDGSTGWYGLGPISVHPDHQRSGVGFRLMQRAIADMRVKGAKGIVLLGDPTYYGRFGFEHDPQLIYPGPPPEYFQRLVLDGEAPIGTVTYAPAFG